MAQRMIFDPLDLPVGANGCVPDAEDFCKQFPERYFSGETFFTYLNNKDLPLWVMTYSASINVPLYAKVRRLLTVHGDSYAVERRRLKGIHTKLFIQLFLDKPHRAFIGSQNLVHPSAANVMVDVTDSLDFFVNYFLHYWHQGQQYGTIDTSNGGSGVEPQELPTEPTIPPTTGRS